MDDKTFELVRQMYLMLQRHQFAGYESYFDDLGENICPECRGSTRLDFAIPGVHTDKCPLEALLKTARDALVETASNRVHETHQPMLDALYKLGD